MKCVCALRWCIVFDHPDHRDFDPMTLTYAQFFGTGCGSVFEPPWGNARYLWAEACIL